MKYQNNSYGNDFVTLEFEKIHPVLAITASKMYSNNLTCVRPTKNTLIAGKTVNGA